MGAITITQMAQDGTTTSSDLNRRVTIQSEVKTPDGQGGFTKTWQNVLTNEPAQCLHGTPNIRQEGYVNQQVQGIDVLGVKIRYRASVNISPAMRLIFGSKIYKKEIMNILKQAAEDTLEFSGQLAPVLTGKMKDSGRVEQTATGYEVSYGDDSGEFDYPWFVEMGTKNMAAQPFLYPAFEIESQSVLDEVTNIDLSS
jgi:HK97 gp10 family phage protein